jgi:hypothetical protein
VRKIALLILTLALLSIHCTATITPLRDSRGRIRRSPAVRREFMRTHVCPSTSWASPKCFGFIVDHIFPLECGGADSPENMQYQSIMDAKIKDRTERLCRLPRAASNALGSRENKWNVTSKENPEIS